MTILRKLFAFLKALPTILGCLVFLFSIILPFYYVKIEPYTVATPVWVYYWSFKADYHDVLVFPHVYPYWFFDYWFSENVFSPAQSLSPGIPWIPIAMFTIQALTLAFGIASINFKRRDMLAAPVCLSFTVLALMLYTGEKLPYGDHQLGYYLAAPSLALFLSAFILNEATKKQQTPDFRLRVDDYKFYRQLFLGFGILLLIIGIALPILTLTFYSPFGSTYYVNSPYWGDGIAMVIIGIILIVLSQILHRRHSLRLQEQQTSSLHLVHNSLHLEQFIYFLLLCRFKISAFWKDD